ncbi:polysaccharide deacetylase family protein [Paenibacillus hexagrammi]|uniref:Polysaccharide deacetylase family protein n=1 Tax=Paenibacillus hexagrammi TaxID=2908839 RepID=A0ABY3SPA5_9BACL|nr:polysaccharide deacetylase family protein [Paenibacillus sp. YPD9-1]UJF35293.1 polysaccharide deacetylase family protein [Paenibacillus sp. YPD9-1]
MTNRLWLAVLSCMLIQLTAGCGADHNETQREQNYTKQELELSTNDESFDSPEVKESANLPMMPTSIPKLPLASSSPIPTPVIQATPMPTAGPSPSAVPTEELPVAKKATPNPKTAKKQTVAVNQNQSKARSTRRLTLSQLVLKYPNTFKLRGPANEKKIALTFDDGPDSRYTPKVLDVLKENHVKATFFLLGAKSSEHPDVVKRIVREGHVIGNHSYSHANLPKLSVQKFQSQIEDTESVLQSLIGYTPRLIRPPYGAINEEQVKWVADHSYLIINWNVDSLDWKSLKSDQVMQNIMRQTKPGSIILQHSGGADSQDLSGTVQALGPLITKLRAAGYTFVTVPELLQVSKSK